MTIQRQPKTQNFPGFPKQLGKGQFYKYPVIMDYWCFCLSGSEQKILDYLIRRTYGFNKIEDTVSLSQFKNGITKRDGTVLDRGTGIKNDSTILKASKSLINPKQRDFVCIFGNLFQIGIKILPSPPQRAVEYSTAFIILFSSDRETAKAKCNGLTFC